MADLNERLKTIVDRNLTPALRKRGYRKSGDAFVKRESELDFVITLQRSRWNDRDAGQITLNCGIHVPRVMEVYRNGSTPKRPRLADCCISARVGMLESEHLDHWWELQADDTSSASSDEQTGKELGRLLEAVMLPFLGMFRDREAVAVFLSRPRASQYRYVEPRSPALCAAYAAIIFCLLDDEGRCQAALGEAVRLAQRTPLEALINELPARMRGLA